ncbi:MAG: hypothetical protein U0790_23775 [Isosphaeraceae bacterium]
MREPRTLRERQQERAAAADRRIAPGEDGGLAVLAQTVAINLYPTAAGACYACVPLQVEGPEEEGAAPSFVADASRTIHAFNLGSQVPPVNTKVILHACGGRWTFRHDG